MKTETNALAGVAAPVGVKAPGAPAVGNVRPAPQPQKQLDGNPVPTAPKPTKAGLATRVGSPNSYGTSGIEAAMGASADKIHPIGGMRAGRS